jgi:hypothetical protein
MRKTYILTVIHNLGDLLEYALETENTLAEVAILLENQNVNVRAIEEIAPNENHGITSWFNTFPSYFQKLKRTDSSWH